MSIDRGNRATGVTYVDSGRQEWEQPAEIVILCAFQLFNVQFLLLSGIGQPYDPARDKVRSDAISATRRSRRRRLFRQGEI